MKSLIKKVLKKILPKIFFVAKHIYCNSVGGKKLSFFQKIKGIISMICTHKFVFPSKKLNLEIAVACQFKRLIELLNFNRVKTLPYFYPLDEKNMRTIPVGYINLASLTLDYAKVLKHDLIRLRKELINNKDDFSQSIILTIDAVNILREKAIAFYSKQKSDRSRIICGYLKNIMSEEPQSFDEALQKILFFNALLWYNHQRHIGLGRLDLVLYPYYQKSLQKGEITKEQAKEHLQDFILTLANNTKYKSGSLIGDTGQVIFISGIDGERKYVENELSFMFLDIITSLNIPDPKIILRANKHISKELWLKSIDCISKGNGSPLIANEEKIMNLMQSFGYEADDCINWGTSACWEPLIIGKSFDQNNCAENISLLRPLVDMINHYDTIDSYAEFERIYINELQTYIRLITRKYRTILFDPSPLHSIWMDGCIEQLKDISKGGAKYNYHGFLAVGLPNAVNALLNIEEYVYNKKMITLLECREVLRNNYTKRGDIQTLFQNNPSKFGDSSVLVLKLTDHIMQTVSDVVAQSTINGQKAKIGFSSPSYINASKSLQASPDGRKYGEPLGVHISPVSHNIGIAEIIQFASRLDYSGNKINGNVVDFIVTEPFIRDRNKFMEILRSAIRQGVYEMQLNVLNADKLIAAKADPGLYPNLVVRVWGFSAYFNDLPEVYKEHLIRRAQMYA
jgi:formate C-acetyltransferase